jgi:hypothetical protein
MLKKIVWSFVLGVAVIGLAGTSKSPIQPVSGQATAPASRQQTAQKLNSVEQGCSVAVFGSNGCKELQQLQEKIEAIRPCAEMSKRGMDTAAKRCFDEAREFERDIRDRIWFQREQ